MKHDAYNLYGKLQDLSNKLRHNASLLQETAKALKTLDEANYWQDEIVKSLEYAKELLVAYKPIGLDEADETTRTDLP
jgi:hypothetical protein